MVVGGLRAAFEGAWLVDGARAAYAGALRVVRGVPPLDVMLSIVTIVTVLTCVVAIHSSKDVITSWHI